jgi:hypothetical protein
MNPPSHFKAPRPSRSYSTQDKPSSAPPESELDPAQSQAKAEWWKAHFEEWSRRFEEFTKSSGALDDLVALQKSSRHLDLVHIPSRLRSAYGDIFSIVHYLSEVAEEQGQPEQFLRVRPLQPTTIVP